MAHPLPARCGPGRSALRRGLGCTLAGGRISSFDTRPVFYQPLANDYALHPPGASRACRSHPTFLRDRLRPGTSRPRSAGSRHGARDHQPVSCRSAGGHWRVLLACRALRGATRGFQASLAMGRRDRAARRRRALDVRLVMPRASGQIQVSDCDNRSFGAFFGAFVRRDSRARY